MNRKSKEIEIYGIKLNLYERNAIDVMSGIELSKRTGFKSLDDILYNSAVNISDSLKLNIKNLKWYDVIKKRQYKKKFSVNYMLKNLGANMILELASSVYVLDGLMKEGETIAEVNTVSDKKKEN